MLLASPRPKYDGTCSEGPSGVQSSRTSSSFLLITRASVLIFRARGAQTPSLQPRNALGISAIFVLKRVAHSLAQMARVQEELGFSYTIRAHRLQRRALLLPALQALATLFHKTSFRLRRPPR